ncbi:hypothetical protein [Streptomyces sp. NPDC059761]|uniref:hypothetical protein n=1 Tax=Streptomyces sp. NPDC059761 TaxID=3346937 RepID=UPI003660B853
MHLRPAAAFPVTLAHVSEDWKSHDRTWTSDACVPEVDYDKPHSVAPTLSLGDHMITLDDDATARLCAFYGVPNAFFGRLTPAERHYVLNSRIDHAEGEVTIEYNATGVTDVRKPSKPRLEAREFLQVAHRLYPSSATVLDAWVTSDDLRLDVIGHQLGNGLHGGIRLAQNRRQNLAPTVSPILYDEASTTTIQINDPSLRIGARGVAVEKIAERLAAEALRADARLSADAQHYADLFKISIAGDSTSRLHRVAAEHGLPVRPLADITMAISRHDEPTMADLVIAIANAANAPKLQDPGKRNVRTKLQAIAGSIITDQADRCSTCHATLAA